MQACPTGCQHIQLKIVTNMQGCPRLDAQGVTGGMKDAGVGLGCPEGGRADAGAEISAQRGAMDIGIAIGNGGNAVAAGPGGQDAFHFGPGCHPLPCFQKDGKGGVGKRRVFVVFGQQVMQEPASQPAHVMGMLGVLGLESQDAAACSQRLRRQGRAGRKPLDQLALGLGQYGQYRPQRIVQIQRDGLDALERPTALPCHF